MEGASQPPRQAAPGVPSCHGVPQATRGNLPRWCSERGPPPPKSAGPRSEAGTLAAPGSSIGWPLLPLDPGGEKRPGGDWGGLPPETAVPARCLPQGFGPGLFR